MLHVILCSIKIDVALALVLCLDLCCICACRSPVCACGVHVKRKARSRPCVIPGSEACCYGAQELARRAAGGERFACERKYAAPSPNSHACCAVRCGGCHRASTIVPVTEGALLAALPQV